MSSPRLTPDEYELKGLQKSKSMRRKYLNPYSRHEQSKEQSPERTDPVRVSQRVEDKKNVEIQVDQQERFQTQPDVRDDSLEKSPQVDALHSDRHHYQKASSQPDRTNQDFERRANHRVVSAFKFIDDENRQSPINTPSPQKFEKDEDDYETFRAKPELDELDMKIRERNEKVLKSRDDRSSRLSYTNRSQDSETNFANSNVKNPFSSSNKPYKNYEMVNESFGSPETKFMKSSKKEETKVTTTKVVSDLGDNDHIIKLLERQERMLERFVPPSRVEPVPITPRDTDQAIFYESSPDVISYQYSGIESPPTCQKTRKKLFYSPAAHKEERQDNHPEYNCNPDTISAMRAKDLHCGRGSSSLRTKFKSPTSVSSRPSSSRRKTAKVEYHMENGVLNITTPAKDTAGEGEFEQPETPKSHVINQLKQENSSLKKFERSRKATVGDSERKGKILHINSNLICKSLIEATSKFNVEAKKDQRLSAIKKKYMQTPQRSGRSTMQR